MPGTVLLLAASPVGKGCLVDAASVLPVLAAVAPAVLSGTETANVVELADPLEPQAVLTRLRAAATAPGPLTMFVTGQLQLDRRQRLPHLALARTTPATVRYTAFPWHWITEELRLRPPGLTSIFVDLHADAEAWSLLSGRPLTAGPSTALYGRVAPPPPRRTVAHPAYMKAVATLLRSGHRPPLSQLHQQALKRTSGEETGRPGPADLVLAPGQRGPVGSVAPADSVAPVTPVTPVASGGPVVATVIPAATVSAATVSAVTVPEAGASAFRPAPGQSWAGQPWPPAPEFTPATPLPPYAPPEAGHAGRTPSVVTASPPSAPPMPLAPPGGEPPTAPAAQAAPRTPAPGTAPSAPSAAERPAGAPSAALPNQAAQQRSSAPLDPHETITTAVRAGRHDEALALAGTWEEEAARVHGPGSEQVLHWMEVRADLAMFAGDPERSCRTWLAVAVARLDAGQAPDAPEVESAVDRAHHQWGRVDAPARARELGSELAALRLRVPGRREGALDHVRQQLRQLQTQA
ncbi:hypothetical protein ABT119_01450 [Streptomyces sp. NPDC001910]|uniref:hypothetical protein n=1 Tax=Streptomyces sp. NPDC001910 TaxID=3154403 RepID=UPI00332A53D9